MNYYKRCQAILDTEADRLAMLEQDCYSILNYIPIQHGPTNLAYVKKRISILIGHIKMYRILIQRQISHSNHHGT
jgi:hypothetical protein